MIVPALQRLDHAVAVRARAQSICLEQAVDGDGVAPVPGVEAPTRHPVGDEGQGLERRISHVCQPVMPAPRSRLPAARSSAHCCSVASNSVDPVALAHCTGKRRERVVADVGRLIVLRPPLHGGLDRRREPLPLGLDLCGVAIDELRQHLAAEDLDRLHDVLVLVAAGLQHEDHLIDAGLLEATEVLADLIRRADTAAQSGGVTRGLLGTEHVDACGGGDRVGVVTLRGSALDVLRPHVGLARLVLAEHVEVTERVAEEVGAFGAAADRLVLVVMHHHRADTGDLRIDAEADGPALLGERALVLR